MFDTVWRLKLVFVLHRSYHIILDWFRSRLGDELINSPLLSSVILLALLSLLVNNVITYEI